MPKDIYGDLYLDGDSLAVLVSETLKAEPLNKLVIGKNKVNGLFVSVFDNSGEKVVLNKKGVYAIYEKKRNRVTCLYVGKSDGKNCIGRRLYRWGIGIYNINKRYEQSHPAASKARKDGITTSKNLYVNFLTWDQIDRIMPKIDKRYKKSILDEKVAFAMRSKYNERGL
jgi:hypothetical protein